MTTTIDIDERILGLVRRHGFVSIDNLSRFLDADPETVRDGVRKLCDAGVLISHGEGAVLQSSAENLAYVTRQALNHGEKVRIGRAVAERIPDRASVLINIGTTTEEVAAALMRRTGLHVVTNNLHVATMMSGKPDFEVIVAGGIVRSRDRGVVGETAVDLVRQFKVDFGIIGISGIDQNGALLDFDYREVRVAQAIIEQSAVVILATDHSKFGRNAMVRLGHLSQVDTLVTDQAPPAPFRAAIDAAGLELVVAEED